MADPTQKSGFDPVNDPRLGALVRIKIVGNADAVFTLPAKITTEGEAAHFLFNLDMKMSGIDPHVNFTDEEGEFISALFQAASGLLQDGVEWKTLKILNREEVKHAADYALRKVQ